MERLSTEIELFSFSYMHFINRKSDDYFSLRSTYARAKAACPLEEKNDYFIGAYFKAEW